MILAFSAAWPGVSVVFGAGGYAPICFATETAPAGNTNICGIFCISCGVQGREPMIMTDKQKTKPTDKRTDCQKERERERERARETVRVGLRGGLG